MLSIEQSVKSQFAKIFSASDWPLFKEVGKIYLSEAAFLKKSAFKAKSRKLLLRNSRKRLLIGVGTELLLKAVYLKNGYCINRPQDNNAAPKFPFKRDKAPQVALKEDDTYQLHNLIDQLKNVVKLQNPRVVIEGLNIAKVFRNKEGHTVTEKHKYVPSKFRAIEAALVELYASAFEERLTVRFSFGTREKRAWRINRMLASVRSIPHGPHTTQ